MNLKMEIYAPNQDFKKSVHHSRSFRSFLPWTLSYETWKSELGVRIRERVREGD